MRILGQSIAAMRASAHPLRLVASLAEASHGSLQDRTLGSLRVSSEGHTVSSIHLSGRRQLAWRTGRLRPICFGRAGSPCCATPGGCSEYHQLGTRKSDADTKQRQLTTCSLAIRAKSAIALGFKSVHPHL